MAHKYDHRYTAGGCAYWRRKDTWIRRNGNKRLRRRVNQAVSSFDEDLIEKEYHSIRVERGVVHWCMYD